MPKKSKKPLERHHVHLYEGDWEELQGIFNDSIGPSGAIREMVRKMLLKFRERRSEQPVSIGEIDISELKEPA